MQCMLDTNHCIYEITGKAGYEPQAPLDECCISVITLGELDFGVWTSTYKDKNRTALNAFLSVVPVVPIEADTAQHYGELRAWLKEQGTPIGPLDTWLAAHALALKLPLVTHNTREFSRVPNLVIDTWLGA